MVYCYRKFDLVVTKVKIVQNFIETRINEKQEKIEIRIIETRIMLFSKENFGENFNEMCHGILT